MCTFSKIYNSNDNRLIITGKCGSGKSIAILCYIYLKYINQILSNKEIKEKILFVQPTNILVEFQRSQVDLISKIFKKVKSNDVRKSKKDYWINKFNLKSFSNILNDITEDDLNSISKSLTESIVNPEKACHIIFDNNSSNISEAIIDEYHIDNMFYKILIIELTFGNLKNFNMIKYISGTPIAIQDKIKTIEIPSSDISSEIYSIKFELIKGFRNSSLKLNHLINDECNMERIQKFYETVVENNGTILIISTSKTENNKQKFILELIENKLTSIKSDIEINKIIVNSENPYSNKLILDDKVNIIISSPNSLTSGITIDKVIIVYDFGVYPIPPSMLSLKITDGTNSNELSNNTVKFYRNSDQTTEQIKHRLGRSDFDGLYIVDKEADRCLPQTEYKDYLHHLILKKTYHDYNIYNHVKEIINNTLPISEYFEWIEDTYTLIWNILENIYDVFYPFQENENQEDVIDEFDEILYNQIKGERIDKIFQTMINHEKDLANFNKIDTEKTKPKSNFNIACRLIYTYVYMNIGLDNIDQKYKISNLIIYTLSQPQSEFDDKIITPKSYFNYFNQQLDFQISDKDLQIIEKSFETFIRPLNNRTIRQQTR